MPVNQTGSVKITVTIDVCSMQNANATQFVHRYLRPQDLKALRNVFFASRKPVAGLYAGRHQSPQRGHSVEFNDFREYTPGDEIGDIDWKVYGRSDKLFIKLFEHQSDMTVNLLLDASASMAYRGAAQRAGSLWQTAGAWLQGLGSTQRKPVHDADETDLRHPCKYDVACLMAAAIAFLCTKQQDKVSFGIAQHGLQAFHRPGGSFAHLHNILTAMDQSEPAGQADLSDALREMYLRTRHRGLLIIFSDLLEDQQAVIRSLSAFTHRGNEVILFHILHEEELKLPDLDEVIFHDSETSQRLRLNVDDIRVQYDQRLKRLLQSWSAACRAQGIDHNIVSTAVPYNKALERYLFSRARMG